MVAHLLLAHPFEAFFAWPIAAQADLNVIPALDVAFVDQAAYRLAVGDEVPQTRVAGVEVGIKVNHAHLGFAVDVGDAGDVVGNAPTQVDVRVDVRLALIIEELFELDRSFFTDSLNVTKVRVHRLALPDDALSPAPERLVDTPC